MIAAGCFNHMTNTTEPQEQLRATFEQLVAAMTEHPQDVNVRLMPSHRKPILVLTCHRSDYGAVLGKKATMLCALKALAAEAGKRHGIELDILLDEAGCTGERKPRVRMDVNPEWDSAPFEKLASLFCNDAIGPCQIALEPVAAGVSKLTVTVTGDWTPTEDDASTFEEALTVVVNCIGARQGHRIVVEVVE